MGYRYVSALLLIACIAGCARPSAPTVMLKCCREAQYQLTTVVSELRAKCPTDAGRVAFDLTESHVRRTFPCRSVRHPEAAVDARLAASVADHDTAGQRADRILSIEQSLGVTPEFPRSQLVWMLGTSVSDFGCDHAGDLAFRKNEIAEARASGEDSTHWLKVEAAYIAGACPAQLDLLYRTVAAAGQPAAVATVRSELHALG